jgi:hypothetical protein
VSRVLVVDDEPHATGGNLRAISDLLGLVGLSGSAMSGSGLSGT